MASKAVLRPSVIQYGVPEDLTEAQYAALIQAIGDWFAKIRNTKEPVALARQVIDCCMRGVKPSDGETPWDSAATAPLAKRIRMACRFDMETMQPIMAASEKSKNRKEKELARQQRKKTTAKVDQNYPEEYRTKLAAEATYGDDPLLFFTSAEIEERTRMRAAYLDKFPQLDNPAAEPKLDQLLDLVVLQKRLRFRNAQFTAGVKKDAIRVTEREMADMIRQVVDLEKAMGIDPVTLAKTQKDKEGGSVGDAVRRLEAMGDWKEWRLRLWAEELILMYQMCMTPSPRLDMGGWQLDEVGLYGLTKTRVCECPQCGTKVFGGFSVDEIEAWLVEKGHLKPVPLPPGEEVTRAED